VAQRVVFGVVIDGGCCIAVMLDAVLEDEVDVCRL
jgi:hypothetical protein